MKNLEEFNLSEAKMTGYEKLVKSGKLPKETKSKGGWVQMQKKGSATIMHVPTHQVDIFKSKGFKVIKEEAESLKEVKKQQKTVSIDPNKGFNAAQLKKLADAYASVDKINTTSDSYKKTTKKLESLPSKVLQQIVDGKIKFLRNTAADILRARKNAGTVDFVSPE
jgi:hypothetical protein